MIIPREIREKIEQRNQLDEEIAGWFQKDCKQSHNNSGTTTDQSRLYRSTA